MPKLLIVLCAALTLSACASADNHRLSDDEIDAAWAKIARERK